MQALRKNYAQVKTAVAIAADVSLNSAMLYGNQFDMDTFLNMFK